MRVWFFSAKQVLWWFFICLTVGIYLGTASPAVLPVFGTQAFSVAGKTIVIDAGHGGPDPGAVSARGALEKEITLNVAKELEYLLKRAAVFTVMVRHGDYDLADSSERNLLNRKRQDLARRVAIAEEAGADLYISIHANYFPSPIWSGAQTFYYEGQEEGMQLARCLQAELVRYLGPNHRLARPGEYRVLRDTSMPAALVEVGFLSNPQEAALLGKKSYQKRIAAAILAGIIRYYNES
ncbi:MAG TPA: cell wall hydrolase [Firmicutes bacterium]|nr:cell wall hydrolase [Bacillota bacterium]